MAPVCLTNGSVFQVEISLKSMIMIISVVLMSSVVTMAIYNKYIANKYDLCETYGIKQPSDITGKIILIVLICVCSTLLVSSLYTAIKSETRNYLVWVLPFVYIILLTIFIGILVTLPSDTPLTPTKTSDSKVSQWCLESGDKLDFLYIMSVVLLGLTVGSTISWMSISLGRFCAF